MKKKYIVVYYTIHFYTKKDISIPMQELNEYVILLRIRDLQ